MSPDPGLTGADYHHLAGQSNQADPGGDQGRGNPFSTSIRILPDLLNVATDLGILAHDIFNHLLIELPSQLFLSTLLFAGARINN